MGDKVKSKHKIEDRVLKEVGIRYSTGLTRLLHSEFKVLRELSGEITGVKASRDMDLLLETDKDYLVNVEFQSTIDNKDKDLVRFLYYASSTMINYNKDVSTYIVYSAKIEPQEVYLERKFGVFRPNVVFLKEILLDRELDRIDAYTSISELTEYDKIILVLSTGLRYNGDLRELIHRAVSIINRLEDSDTVGSIMAELSSKFLDDEEYNFLKGEIGTMNIFRDIKEEVTREVTEEVTKKVTEEVTKKVSEEVTKKVSEEVTKKVSEETRESERTKTILLMSKTLSCGDISNILKLPLAYVTEIIVKNTTSSSMNSFGDMN